MVPLALHWSYQYTKIGGQGKGRESDEARSGGAATRAGTHPPLVESTTAGLT